MNIGSSFIPNLLFHKKNAFPSVAILWGILILVITLSTIVNVYTETTVGLFFSVTENDASVSAGTMPDNQNNADSFTAVSSAGAALVALMIFSVVIGLISQPENFSFLLGLGSSRKAFFLAQMTALTAVGFINATLHSAAIFIESMIFPLINLHQINYFDLYNFSTNYLTLTLTQGLLFTLVSSVCVVISALFYRYKSRNLIIFFVAGIVFGTAVPLQLAETLFGSSFRWFFLNNPTALVFAGKIILLLAIFWSLSWLIIRRTPAR